MAKYSTPPGPKGKPLIGNLLDFRGDPANSIILMSQYVTHHDPRFYPEPFRFDPERWTAEAQAARPRFSYFPFGGGPRLCIGEQFAWMEGVLILATIARQWRMRLAPDQVVVPEPLITLRPKFGMRMTLERRDGPPLSVDRLAAMSATIETM